MTEAPDNRGNPGTDSDNIHPDYDHNNYPFTDAPRGDSSIVEFVINDEGPEGISKSSGTIWYRWLEIEKQEVDGPTGIKNEKGEILEIEPVGFATMSGLNLLNREDASEALTKTRKRLTVFRLKFTHLQKLFRIKICH